MNVAEMMDFINNIEDDYPVDEWEAGGIKIWPLVRFRLVEILQKTDQKNAISRNQHVSRLKKRLKMVFNAIIELFYELRIFLLDNKNNDTFRKADAVFMFNSPKTFIENKWVGLSQPYYEALKSVSIDTIVVQLNPQLNCNIPRGTKSVLIKAHLFYVNLLSHIKFYMFYRTHMDITQMKVSYYDNFLDYCMGKNMNTVQLNKAVILRKVFYLKELNNYFKTMLTSIEPLVCFKVCYYNHIGMALNLACRELKIPSVDVQHGVQGEYHWAYGRWNKVPRNGYELLPRYFWCWSDEDVKTIEKWSKNQKYHRAFDGGNLWLAWWLVKDFSEHVKSLDVSDQLHDHKNKIIKILYTLQKFHNSLEQRNIVYKAINQSPENWQWLFRVRPSERILIPEAIKEANQHCKRPINIDDASNLPLALLLKEVTIHITASSTCVLDAKEFGVPSVVISETGKIYYSKLIESGWVNYAGNAEELISSIKGLLDKEKQNDKKSLSITSNYEAVEKFILQIKQENYS